MNKNVCETERRFCTSVFWTVSFEHFGEQGTLLTNVWSGSPLTLDSFKKMTKDIEEIFEEMNKKKKGKKK